MKNEYKQTELGVIPEDWELRSISSLIGSAEIKEHIDGNHGELYPRSSEFVEDGVPYISATDFATGRVNFNGCKYLTEERCGKFQKGLAKSGDVLFAHNATVGPVAFLETDFDYIVLSTTATLFRTDNNRLLNHFLRYALQSDCFVKQYQAVMSQSTRFQVPITTQRKFSIPLPPTIAEQTAIATALSDMDNLIAGLEQLIEKKKAIKQGAMQELMRPKEGWVVKKLGDVFSFFSTSNYSKAEMSNDGEVGCIHYGLIHGIANTNYSLSNGVKYYVTNEQAKYEKIQDGDVVMVDASEDLVGLNKSIEISDVGDKQYIAGLHTFHLRDENNFFVKKFRGLILNSTYIKNQMLRLAVGMKVFGVSKPQLQQVLLPLPPIDVQLEISNILSNMDNEIMLLEENSEKCKLLKQGMMQELLTGKTRLV